MPLWGILLIGLGIAALGYLLLMLMLEKSERWQEKHGGGLDPASIALPGLFGVIITLIGGSLALGAIITMATRVDWPVVLG